MIKKNKLPISIVIPTLGKDHLVFCLNKINNSSFLPKEVLIVVPIENYKKTKRLRSIYCLLNIKVLLSKKRNQVHQRILGFKNVKYEYVMQLDDDVKLDKYCLLSLYNFLKGKKNCAVAPRYADKVLLSKIYVKPKSLFLKIYHWLLNSKKGYAPGTVSLCGFNYADEKNSFGFKNHEWLSGGAIMHNKKNLILNNYYPYNFKRSICEDILHSFLLRKNNINLVKLYKAKVFAAESSRINNPNNLSSISKNFINEFLIRRYIVKKFNLSIFRLYIYYFIYALRIIKNLVKNEK